ncbi:hypothetical protein RRG08_028381 [Elysia crispata]|uniref:Uncharacterized protein n=1 Tax=Elysia crispata TaxID=231223 RepID=A0AAE1EDE4_9GAST|nr:hypothetical protein RRG08_028381 [Elysia crispata]
MYYKTKLVVRNLTFYNLTIRDGYCYVFDEVNGELSSAMLASIHYQRFSSYLDKNTQMRKIIIWSDGSGCQNECCTVSNALEHRYLVPGYTQMECNSMHSMIDRKMNVDRFVPHDYAIIMQLA